MLPQKPRPAHHSPLHSHNVSNSDLQPLSEGYAFSPYCLSGEHFGAQPAMPTLGNGDSIHGGTEDWFKAGTAIDGTAASVSSYSSVYSSPEQQIKLPSTAAKSETSGRSSLISQHPESERSISSQRHAPQPQRPKNRADQASKSPNHSISSYTFGRIKEKERNPLKWLYRRSDANMRNSNQTKSEQQQDLGQQPRTAKQRQEEYYEVKQTIPQKFGPDLLDKMEKLEEKLDTLIVSHFSTSRSTGSPGSSIACPATFEPKDNTECRQIQGKEIDAYSHIEATNMKEKGQKPAQNSHDDQDKVNQKQYWEVLAAEIDRLIKSNNKLSACIDALGTSGLIELIDILSSSIERLNSELASLRRQQQQSNTLREEAVPKSNDDNQEQQSKALEIQANTIQRLGVLLGRREEQLKHEKRATKGYNETISGLERMVRVLEVEWQSVMPLVYSSGVTRPSN